MKSRILIAALLLTAAPLAAQTPPAPLPASASAAAAAAATPSAALKALFAASDELAMYRNPIQALFRGDPRYAEQFGDYISDAYIAREKAAAEDELAALAKIDSAKLTPEEQISYDVFKWQRTTDLRGLQPDILAATIVRPIDHFNGLHTFYPDIASGEGVAPFKTVADYENNLKRLAGYDAYLDAAIGRFRQGMATGVVQPKLVVDNVIGQLDTLIAQGVEGSTFYKPVTKFPDSFSAADKARLTAEYRQTITTGIIPALTRLRDFLKTDYLPKARDSVGLYAMPGGKELYQYLIQSQTTTNMTADEIHAIGLAEVDRITKAMTATKDEIGFKGSLKEFFEYVRTDPKFKPKSKEALGDLYRGIEKRLEPTLPTLFSTIPRSPLEIRAVPAFLEKNQAGGYYQQGTPDGSRPGVFYYNTYDLPSRTIEGAESLFLHEGNPGHHFQISLAQENASLPPFQRFGGNTAFVEGWALYAESLGKELGLYKDPVQLYGRYDSEIFRAIRLVVDTGIHAKGWTRDQAIAYMMEHSATGKTDATAEIERYIAIPGQALAYKTGQLDISRNRAKAEKALGAKFDIREFHAQVLMSGALPLEVLDAKIDRWIAAKQGS